MTFWIGTSWKMNKLRDEAVSFAAQLCASPVIADRRIQPFVIPPFFHIAEVAAILRGSRVMVGAQNMHWADHGAWTGEISAPMVKEQGASLVEIGHSERRTNFGETDETVALKVEAALRHGLTALVCIGDARSEHEAGETAEALERQTRAALSKASGTLKDRVILAYEPVWSIGEGGVPADPAFADEQQGKVKALARAISGEDLTVLYGGSVSPENCLALAAQPHIDGLFIGRSAWDVAGYVKIMDDVARHLETAT